MKTASIPDKPISERESAILRALIFEYISTGKPVGSRSFVQKYSFSISPATMRNVMFDLEAMGYLMRPHASSGRLPTDKGYRFYVDLLMDTYDTFDDKKEDERAMVKKLYDSRIFPFLICIGEEHEDHVKYLTGDIGSEHYSILSTDRTEDLPDEIFRLIRVYGLY